MGRLTVLHSAGDDLDAATRGLFQKLLSS